MGEGKQVFDSATKTDAYRAWRHHPNSPNKSIEEPIILELLGDVTNTAILDLGCGDAIFGQKLLAMGCQAYTGIESSHQMVDVATEILAGSHGNVIHDKIETWAYPETQFDLVLSRLALHYVANLDQAFANVYKSLRPGGRFVFSILHPVISSCDESREGNRKRQNWIVDRYFEPGPRQVYMMDEYIEQHHRTIESIYRALQNAGFSITSLREAQPRRENFTDEALFKRRSRIPLFLFLASQKQSR